MLIFSNGPKVYVTAVASLILAWFVSVSGFWLDGGRSQRKLEKILTKKSQADPEIDRLE